MRSLLLSALCCACLAFPSPILNKRKYANDGPAQNTGTIESWFDKVYDVSHDTFITGKYVIRHLDIGYSSGRRTASCPNSICLWPSSPDGFVYIPYNISSDFKPYDVQMIKASLSNIEDSTCIRFRPQTSETDYIAFTATQGCWSALGHIGGVQVVSLQRSGCIWSGVIIHEVLHTLGLHHEHVRLDRDDYVAVQWDNIDLDALPNFVAIETYNAGLTAYDYNSIMHYSNTAFSSNGVLPTLITTSDSKIQLGQQFSMSALDIKKINSLYQCRVTTSAPTTQSTTTTTPRARRTSTATTASTSRTTKTSTVKPTTTRRTTTTVKPTTTRTATTTTAISAISNGCGGNLTSSKGIITSPNFPNNYPNNAYCHWNITTNVQFKVTFTDFHIEDGGTYCLFDKLRIYNGRDFDYLYELDDLCGKTPPSPITSYINSMQIVFISDSSVAWKGFRLVYQPV